MGARCTFTTPAPVTGPPGWLSSGITAHRAPAPPEPLFAAAAERGIRWVSHDRPGYGGSTPHPDRDVASAAADVPRVADAVGISAPAPFGAEGLDWFAGMTPSGAAEYRAAATGRAALEAYLASAEFDPEVFTPADHAALFGAWSWMGPVDNQALETDQGGGTLATSRQRARLDPQLQRHGPGLAPRARQSRLSPNPPARSTRAVQVIWRVLSYLAGLPGWMSRDLVARVAGPPGR